MSNITVTITPKPTQNIAVTQPTVVSAVIVGIQGPPGIQGPIGPKGADSTVPGPKGEDSTVPGPKGDDSIIPGPIGPTGLRGDATIVGILATQPLSGHRAVTINGDYVDPTSLASLLAYAGITLSATNAGEAIDLQVLGEIVEPSWNWTPDFPLFISNAGALTQAVPTGNVLPIGVALEPTKIFVSKGTLLMRS